MTLAAGIMFVTPDNLALFIKRGPGGDHPGEWCFPGGHLEDNETPEAAARREAHEEAAWADPDLQLEPWTRTHTLPEGAAPGDDVTDFTTFRALLKEEFVPELGPAAAPEHVGYAWAPVDQPPQPLHPGCAVALERLSMNELGVARAIADGRLTSPQFYKNVMLYALRITGTGRSYRPKLKEHVWRPPEEYLHEDFLARCNGLIVILRHPEKRGTLNSEEFVERVAGSIFVPYIKGDEVWGVAKIYDDEAIKLIVDGKILSTSPGVQMDPRLNTKVRLEDGKSMLFESDPVLVDHLALCEAGVWDKGGDPTGIDITDSISTGDTTMADEDKKEEVKEAAKEDRKDGNIDMLLEKLDACMGRMDAIGGRMDAMEKERQDRLDAARKDGEDDEGPKEDKEREDKKDARKDELPPEFKKEEKKDARKDADEDKEEKKEAVAEDKKDARKDADEDRDDGARGDALEIASLKKQLAEQGRQINSLARLVPKQQSDTDREAFAAAQFRADSAYSSWNQRAPAAMLGEELPDYRRRLLKGVQQHSGLYGKSNLYSILDESAFDGVEQSIYNDAIAASKEPSNIPGQLRTRTKTDATGRTITEFEGSPAAWMGRFGGLRRRAKLRSPSRVASSFQ